VTYSQTRTQALALASITLLAFGACSGTPETTSSGMLPALWTPPDESSREVPFAFEGEGAGTGMLFTTLGRGGEHFRGRYVLLEDSTEGHLVTAVYDGWSAPEWNIWEKEPDGQWTAEATSYGDFADFYTGRVVAYLPGSEGHAMRCRFTLNEPQGGFLKGGKGECQTTRGSRLDLEF
jgi:hypothetical protein